MNWINLNVQQPLEGQVCLVWHEKVFDKEYAIATYHSGYFQIGLFGQYVLWWHPLQKPDVLALPENTLVVP